MYDQLYKQALFGTAVLELFALIALVLFLWWLWHAVGRLRSGSGGALPVVIAGGLALSTAFLAVALAAFAFLALPAVIASVAEIEASKEEQAALVDQPAPELRFHGVADDRHYDLEEFHGAVVLVNFWATWCGPCRREMPDLERLSDDLGPRGLTVIHLSEESRETIGRYLRKKRLTNLHVYAGSTQWPAYALPTTYVVDREGVIREFLVGSGDYAQFSRMVEPYL